jgi:hypothetical protein
MTDTTLPLPAEQLGPAERMLDIVLNSSAHLWHNRPGYDVAGVWQPARRGTASMGGVRVRPGLFVPAAAALYSRLLDIFRLNVDLMAHFASFALKETDWRDLKVACCALMLVQPRSGQPVHDDDGSVGFYDDDYRAIGEAMILHYERKSPRMMTPKGVLRVAELLETADIATLNRAAGFADPAAKKAPLGRWQRAATKWLKAREQNRALLEELVKAGYKETIKQMARKAGYKPESEDFFGILGWKQKQSAGGHRSLGLDGLKLDKRERFDELSEAEICETIETQRLSYKDVVGRLPAGSGITPAIMVALLPSLSARRARADDRARNSQALGEGARDRDRSACPERREKRSQSRAPRKTRDRGGPRREKCRGPGRARGRRARDVPHRSFGIDVRRDRAIERGPFAHFGGLSARQGVDRELRHARHRASTEGADARGRRAHALVHHGRRRDALCLGRARAPSVGRSLSRRREIGRHRSRRRGG